ncbi:MAG TPA: YraN family protein [Acetobacteraceae bacterium]|nr:YraN family protein [Acetobacteraceae bacterium]
MSARGLRGRRSDAGGRAAESRAGAALAADGWRVLGRRIRTEAGEVDLVAEKAGVVAFVEVKSRATLAEAAFALTPRQRGRLMAAADILLAAHPEWGAEGVRFDVVLVDAAGAVRRLADAFRREA